MLDDWCQDNGWWCSYCDHWAESLCDHVCVCVFYNSLISHISHSAASPALRGAGWSQSVSLSFSVSVWPMEGTRIFAQWDFVTTGPLWRQDEHMGTLSHCHTVILSVFILQIGEKLNQSMHQFIFQRWRFLSNILQSIITEGSSEVASADLPSNDFNLILKRKNPAKIISTYQSI